jgi:hypothetical protein
MPKKDFIVHENGLQNESDVNIYDNLARTNSETMERECSLSPNERLLACGTDDFIGLCPLVDLDERLIPSLCILIHNLLPRELFEVEEGTR